MKGGTPHFHAVLCLERSERDDYNNDKETPENSDDVSIQPEEESQVTAHQTVTIKDTDKNNDPSNDTTNSDDDKNTVAPSNDENNENTEDNAGDTLPETATNMFNFMLIGFSLLITGAILFFIKRKRSVRA